MNYREKMREYLKEPNEICNHYGKWGILNKEQRDLITRLLNEMDGADNYIIKLQQENQQLKERIEYLERSNNRREDTIIEQRQEISDLEDNWNKLKEYMIKEQVRIVIENLDEDEFVYADLLDKMQEQFEQMTYVIEKGDDK